MPCGCTASGLRAACTPRNIPIQSAAVISYIVNRVPHNYCAQPNLAETLVLSLITWAQKRVGGAPNQLYPGPYGGGAELLPVIVAAGYQVGLRLPDHVHGESNSHRRQQHLEQHTHRDSGPCYGRKRGGIVRTHAGACETHSETHKHYIQGGGL